MKLLVVMVLKHYALLKIWIINVSDVQFDINFSFFYTGCPQVLRLLQLQEASCPYFLCLLFAFFMEFKILLAIMSCHKCCIQGFSFQAMSIWARAIGSVWNCGGHLSFFVGSEWSPRWIFMNGPKAKGLCLKKFYQKEQTQNHLLLLRPSSCALDDPKIIQGKARQGYMLIKLN